MKRSYKKELLDADDIPEQALVQTLKELNTINDLLGGYAISFDALRQVLVKGREAVIADIGCGGGDTLKRINSWSKANGYTTRLYGVDMKEVCIAHSRDNNKDNPEITFICDDYRNTLNHVPGVDVLHACLFCHHLMEQDIAALIRYARASGAILIVNDLQRHPVAWLSIKLLTQLFSRSYLVRNDAALSVLRGFKKREWQAMLQQAGATKYSIKNKWAFRHQIIVYP